METPCSRSATNSRSDASTETNGEEYRGHAAASWPAAGRSASAKWNITKVTHENAPSRESVSRSGGLSRRSLPQHRHNRLSCVQLLECRRDLTRRLARTPPCRRSVQHEVGLGLAPACGIVAGQHPRLTVAPPRSAARPARPPPVEIRQRLVEQQQRPGSRKTARQTPATAGPARELSSPAPASSARRSIRTASRPVPRPTSRDTPSVVGQVLHGRVRSRYSSGSWPSSPTSADGEGALSREGLAETRPSRVRSKQRGEDPQQRRLPSAVSASTASVAPAGTRTDTPRSAVRSPK